MNDRDPFTVTNFRVHPFHLVSIMLTSQSDSPRLDPKTKAVHAKL
jgi:hypothetical protein